MLPKINKATFKLTLPSDSKTEITYRSFLVKEEKILLLAKEEGTTKAMIHALKQIVNNCVVEDINVDKLPLFDLEYIFLMIRAKSQNDKIELKYTDPTDEKEYDALFDYGNIKVVHEVEHNPVIDLDGNIGVVMRYPTISDLEKLKLFDNSNGTDFSGTQAMDLIKNCIKEVYDEDNSYPWDSASQAEKDEFFESLSGEYMGKIKKFFDTFPSVVGIIEYRKDKAIITKEVKGIANFM